MPVAVVRARLRGDSLAAGLPSDWKFYDFGK